MTTAAEITAQIDAIEKSPEYRRLNTISRGPFENKSFQLMTLQLNTLRLRRDDLVKRENPSGVPPPKPASPLVVPTDRKRLNVLTSPTKAIPDPPPERKPVFQAKVRSAHLQAPSGPKVHKVTGAPQQNLVVVPTNGALPPPVDTSMPAARRGPTYKTPDPPAPKAEAEVTAVPETGKLVKTPTAISPPAITKSASAGRVAPVSRAREGGVGAPAVVAKPKGLASLTVVDSAFVISPVKAKAQPKRVDDPERAAARRALTTEVETVSFLDEMDFTEPASSGDDCLIEDILEEMKASERDDNIVGELSAIGDMDGVGFETEEIPEPPKAKKPVAKKSAKKSAAKKV